MHVAVHDLLDIVWVRQCDQQIIPQPTTTNVAVFVGQLQGEVHDLVVGLSEDQMRVADQGKRRWSREFISHLHKSRSLLPVVQSTEKSHDRDQG